MKRTFLTSSVGCIALCLASGVALAQGSNISASHKFCWSENAGWINTRDAGNPDGAEGLRIDASILSGFGWSENLGWINFGDGSPTNGVSYANVNGTDFGVNKNAVTGDLSGFAWSENTGWINFGWALAANVNRPRFESGRLRGFAWGENIGWINLGNDEHYVGLGCPADLDDGSGTGTPDDAVTIDDLLYFLVAFEEGSTAADLDNGSGLGTPDGGVTIDDLLYFLIHFEGGC